MPITGRMHQIRIHLTCLKAPIVCDPTYGGEMIYLSDLKRGFNLKKDTDELPLMKRVALHARSLTFRLLNDEQVTIEAPYPKDFDVLVKQLNKFS
jgi:23S rRNA pseudouridine955/2504/2580 synthase